VSAGRRYRLKFDRAEPIRKVSGEDCNEKHDCHRSTGKRDERANQHGEASEELDKNRRPRCQRRRRHVKGVQNVREQFGASPKLCVAVLHETVADNQSKGMGQACLSDGTGRKERATKAFKRGISLVTNTGAGGSLLCSRWISLIRLERHASLRPAGSN